MGEPNAREHRPLLYADLTRLIDAAGGEAPTSPAQTAAATARAVLDAARACADQAQRTRFVTLADRVGLDTLSALWRDSEPASLPRVLWALFVLRQWCHGSGAEVARLWRAGEPIAAVDAVIAGTPQYADAGAIEDVADSVLTGICCSDIAVALERASSLFRVIAAGRRELGEASPVSAAGADQWALAERNEQTARELTRAARRCRCGALY